MYKIVNAECLADKIYLMDVEAPRVARACQPGEFVIVKMDEVGERIPLTICDFDREKGLVTIVFQIVGASTMRMAELKAGETVNTLSMLLGNIRGTIGETSVVAIMIGAMFLILMGVIDLRIPGTYIVTFVIFITLFGGHGFDPQYITAHLCGGGLMLGAWFMATDYVTSPITSKGKILFGICLGCLTGLFRLFGGSAEGVSYAIIISNLLVPLIEKVTLPKPFGKGGEK